MGILKLWIVLVTAFLDRWGGGGFAFLGIKKGILSRGVKAARRFGIPGLLWGLNPTLDQAFWSGTMAAVFSTDLDEIEDRKWDTIALYGIALAGALRPLAGYWALIVPAWWLVGTYWSNIGINGKKLGWHWVELVRGATIGLSVWLNTVL